MLHREDETRLILIGQPAHSWVSGQLARAWGNERFGRFEPWEEVCLAAEQHDIGMAAWDAAPELNEGQGFRTASGSCRAAPTLPSGHPRRDSSCPSPGTRHCSSRFTGSGSTSQTTSRTLRAATIRPRWSTSADGEATITATPAGDDPSEYVIDPWPFGEDAGAESPWNSEGACYRPRTWDFVAAWRPG